MSANSMVTAAWKREALQVIEEWERCYEALEQAGHPAQLGQSKSGHVRQWIGTHGHDVDLVTGRLDAFD